MTHQTMALKALTFRAISRTACLIASLLLTHTLPARAEPPPPGPWSLVEVDGAPVTFSATLDLSQPGRAMGRAPCNRYFARLVGIWPDIRFAAIGGTRMACDALEAENAYLAALGRVTMAEIALPADGSADTERLLLSGPDGVPRLVFAPLPPTP